MTSGKTLKWLIFIFQLLIPCVSNNISYHGDTHNTEYNKTFVRKLIFGGLFPIHSGKVRTHDYDPEPGISDHESINYDRKTSGCGEINIERGIHRWQAMLFAVKEINENPSILPGVKIEVDIHDTCQQDTVALEALVKTIFRKIHGNKEECDMDNLQDGDFALAGVIGAASSSVSIEVANLLRLFRIPQISYASTSSILTDRIKYSYFVRTVPPDFQQVNAMTDFIRHMNWTSVFILYSLGSYGESGYESLKIQSRQKNICVVDKFKITADTDVGEVLNKMKTYGNTRVVILFLTIPHIRKVLKAAGYNPYFTWIGSDYWGTRQRFLDTPEIKSAANNAITITLKSSYSYEKFQNYFCDLKPILFNETKENQTNEWFNEYWIKNYNCSLSEPHCLNIPICQDVPSFDDKVPYVIDAVYALASAVDKLLKSTCRDHCNQEIFTLKGSDILQILLSSEYEGVYGRTRFDKNGSASHGYDIMQYNNGNYFRIGEWNDVLNVTKKLIRLNNSFCSRPCNISGYVKKPVQGSPECCYACYKCGTNEIAVNGTCVACPVSSIPNIGRDGCQELPIQSISRIGLIIVALLTSIGVFLTTLVAAIFYYYKDTEVVRSSAPELTFPLLIGLLLCHSLAYIVVADQTDMTCAVYRFGIGFSFCVCYSSLLTKINRLDRVFKYNKHSRSRRGPRFISASSQLVIMCGIVFIEGGLAIIGLMKQKPSLKPIKTDMYVLYVCEVPIYDAIVALAYNALLVIISTIYAFRTRKVPPAFNEARYIGFVMYTTCTIWLSYILLYFINISYENKIIALGINITINATSILAGLFGPKIYIILFRPTRNRRSTSASSQSLSLSFSQSLCETDRNRQPKKRSKSVYSDVSRYPNSSDYHL